MGSSKESKINKYIQYAILCICLFAVFIVAAMFVLGNTAVFSWDSGVRLAITALTGAIMLVVIMKNNYRRRK